MQLTKQFLNKTTLSSFLLFLIIGLGLFFGRQALAEKAPSQWLPAVMNNGLGQIANTDYNEPNKPKDIRTITANLTNVFLGLLGTIFIILMIAAGFLWMTAGGNSEKVKRATQLMTAGVIGLLIIIAAFAISLYVTSRTIYSVEQGIMPGGVDEVPDPSIKTNEKYNKLF